MPVGWLWDGAHPALALPSTTTHGLRHTCTTAPTLPREQVREDDVRAFFDRLCWVSVGQEPDIASLQQSLHIQLADKSLTEAERADSRLALEALKQAAKAVKVLLVLDDVWDVCHHLCASSPRARRAYGARRASSAHAPRIPRVSVQAAHAAPLNFVDPSDAMSAVVVTTRIRSLLDNAAEVPCHALALATIPCPSYHLVLLPPPSACYSLSGPVLGPLRRFGARASAPRRRHRTSARKAAARRAGGGRAVRAPSARLGHRGRRHRRVGGCVGGGAGATAREDATPPASRPSHLTL